MEANSPSNDFIENFSYNCKTNNVYNIERLVCFLEKNNWPLLNYLLHCFSFFEEICLNNCQNVAQYLFNCKLFFNFNKNTASQIFEKCLLNGQVEMSQWLASISIDSKS
jgi:hypothetical protein